ncbi:L-fucose-proton symporter [Planctomycetes bacterium CA13]|uniref:L-fucose-proton symporter n=1 Tax=Novipirellula herctigrandis TaxID=2527986 RepID=A0A5C5Z8L7_9BACT|nr:L-fucose-proton symporter [Planctomycetes bacterium CA13]
MKNKTFPIFLAFLVMGVADAMGPMSDAIEEQFNVSKLVATLLPFFVFLAFAVFSVPGGLLAGRIGKKNLLLLGLGLNAVAMLIPSVVSPGFALLLGCIFVLGIGTTFLQVAGNPIMRDVSPEGTYSRNLSLAQGIKGLGSASSAYLVIAVTSLTLFQSMGWRGSFPIFFVLMVVAFVLVAMMKVDEAKPDVPPSIGSSLSLLKQPVFLMAVLGIFLYVGAEVCMGRFLKPALTQLGFSDERAAFMGPTSFFLILTVGRLLGGVILSFLSPQVCLRGSALLGVIGGVLLMTGSSPLAIPGVVLAGFGFANIWPLLFSITVEDQPDRANELSGLMCMAISGGAFVPLVMGWLGDLEWGATAFIVPVICFAYLFMISLRPAHKADTAQS